MEDVTFQGISKRPSVGSVTIDGVALRKDVPTQVSQKLADEIRSGSARLKGMRFKSAEPKTEETS